MPFTILAIAAFVWPLLGIHQLLGVEKGCLLSEALQRFELTIADLHRRIDDGKFDEMDALNTTIDCLEREMNALSAIPTWPWQPEPVRWLTTALVLPLALWIIQSVLQRVLSP